jgi:hypothetical protein
MLDYRGRQAATFSFRLGAGYFIVGLFSIAYAGHLAGHNRWRRASFFAPIVLAPLSSITTIIIAFAFPWGRGC